jgi:hypothetical protein
VPRRFGGGSLCPHSFWFGRDLVAPTNQPLCGQLADFERSEIRQDPSVEDVFGALNGRRFLFGGDLGEIILDGIRNLVRTRTNDAGRDKALQLGPVPGLDLRLPIVKDGDVRGNTTA